MEYVMVVSCSVNIINGMLPQLSGRGWHLIYVHTSIGVALVVLRTTYIDRVYRENLGMD